MEGLRKWLRDDLHSTIVDNHLYLGNIELIWHDSAIFEPNGWYTIKDSFLVGIGILTDRLHSWRQTSNIRLIASAAREHRGEFWGLFFDVNRLQTRMRVPGASFSISGEILIQTYFHLSEGRKEELVGHSIDDLLVQHHLPGDTNEKYRKSTVKDSTKYLNRLDDVFRASPNPGLSAFQLVIHFKYFGTQMILDLVMRGKHRPSDSTASSG